MNSLGPGARATRRYFDSTHNCEAIKVLPNEYYVTGPDQNVLISTVLGSCVAACVRDTVSGAAGMNHFMLPGGENKPASATMRYGAYAMEVLINEVLKAGAQRERLEAKVFGGGAVLAQMKMLDIGNRNADFVLEYLQMENIRVSAQDLRGPHARRVNFFSATGKVMVRKLASHQHGEELVLERERALQESLRDQPRGGRVELFGLPARKSGSRQEDLV